MCKEWDGYENTGYIGEENIKKGTSAGGRARNMGHKYELGIEGAI